MKKFTLALLAAALLTAMIATSVFAGIQGYVIGATLYGGQTANKVGFTRIWNDEDSLNVYFMMRGGAGWCLEEAGVHVGATLDDFPLTSNGGNLIPGHFDYKADMGGCVRDFLFEIPLADLAAKGIFPGMEDDFFMAIHAVAFNRYTGQQETGWSVRCGDLDGQQFPGPGWEGYIRFTPDAWYLFD
jgi:hypothetical protein